MNGIRTTAVGLLAAAAAVAASVMGSTTTEAAVALPPLHTQTTQHVSTGSNAFRRLAITPSATADADYANGTQAVLSDSCMWTAENGYWVPDDYCVNTGGRNNTLWYEFPRGTTVTSWYITVGTDPAWTDNGVWTEVYDRALGAWTACLSNGCPTALILVNGQWQDFTAYEQQVALNSADRQAQAQKTWVTTVGASYVDTHENASGQAAENAAYAAMSPALDQLNSLGDVWFAGSCVEGTFCE